MFLVNGGTSNHVRRTQTQGTRIPAGVSKICKHNLLLNLKMEKQNDQEMEVFEGSRKIKANKYIREEETGVLRGAPFPQNLRPILKKPSKM